MNEPHIQFSPLPVAEANMVLEGLKRLPLGDAYNLFTRLFNEAQAQVQAAQQPLKKSRKKADPAAT